MKLLAPHAGEITESQRSLELLRPSAPPSVPYLGAGSTSNTIVIQWEESVDPIAIPSPFFYRVDYSLDRGNGNVVTRSETVTPFHLPKGLHFDLVFFKFLQTSNTFLTLENQQPETMVSVNVSTLSLWAQSSTAASDTFASLPASQC